MFKRNEKFIVIAFVLLVGLIISNSSCKKKIFDRSTTTSLDNSISDGVFSDVFKVVDEVVKDSNSYSNEKALRIFTFQNTKTKITFSSLGNTFPKTIEIDFGEEYSYCSDLKNRKGIINVSISAPYRSDSCVIKTTFDNYYVNGYKVEGEKTVSSNGRNSAGNLSYDVVISDGKLTSEEDFTLSWDSQRTREWIEGEETTFLTDGFECVLDDVYSITGSATGVNRDGLDYTFTIKEALEFQVGCKWIRKGVLEIEPDGLNTRTIDYGDGTCDNKADVTIKKKTYKIYMK